MACKFWSIIFTKIYIFYGAISDVKRHIPVSRILKLPHPRVLSLLFLVRFDLECPLITATILFLQALRICCQDMFFGRSRTSPTAFALTGTLPSLQNGEKHNPLHNAFRYTENTAHRLNVVEELFNTKINQPLEKDVSNEVRFLSILKLRTTLQTCLYIKPII